jgi:predicted RNase H-like HicB family nuclease
MFTDCDKNLKEALALYREDLGLDEEEEDEEWD